MKCIIEVTLFSEFTDKQINVNSECYENIFSFEGDFEQLDKEVSSWINVCGVRSVNVYSEHIWENISDYVNTVMGRGGDVLTVYSDFEIVD